MIEQVRHESTDKIVQRTLLKSCKPEKNIFHDRIGQRRATMVHFRLVQANKSSSGVNHRGQNIR